MNMKGKTSSPEKLVRTDQSILLHENRSILNISSRSGLQRGGKVYWTESKRVILNLITMRRTFSFLIV